MPATSTTPFRIACIIFAGGRSSRMGRNKALLPFGGSPTLAQYQYARLSPLFDETYLSVRSPSGFPAGIPMLSDDPAFDERAPTAGFISAFRTLGAGRIFAISVDTPFIDETVIAALLAADTGDADAVVARTGEGLHPLCGIYHRSLLPRFEAMAAENDHKLGKMLRGSRVVYVDFKREEPFANLNHPHEYAAALQRFHSQKD